MALPINIEDILNYNRNGSNKVEFKKDWNPKEIYHSICAFANDIDNLDGGYILVGVDQDKNGVAIRPVLGVPEERIDTIEKEMVGFNNKISPFYRSRTSREIIDGKVILVIWVPAGTDRPYSVRVDVTEPNNPKTAYYVRNGSTSIVAKGGVLNELFDLASREPFDVKGNPEIKEKDIDLLLIRNHLRQAKSKMLEDLPTMDMMEILDDLKLLTGPTEHRLIRNLAAMMFCNEPEKFFEKMQISVVIFHEGLEENPDRFTEKTFTGSLPELINNTLNYIENTVIQEYVSKPESSITSERWFNYPIRAIKEGIVNAMYHRDYRLYHEVEIAIEPHEIRILSYPGPDRSISMDDIKEAKKLRARRYRHIKMADFLKVHRLGEGRSTGIPSIQKALTDNGSPRATIETDEDRTYFLLTIPVHPHSLEITPVIDVPRYKPKDKRKVNPKIEKVYNLIKQNPYITQVELGRKTEMSIRSIQNCIKELKNRNRIQREGGDRGGYWEII